MDSLWPWLLLSSALTAWVVRDLRSPRLSWHERGTYALGIVSLCFWVALIPVIAFGETLRRRYFDAFPVPLVLFMISTAATAVGLVSVVNDKHKARGVLGLILGSLLALLFLAILSIPAFPD